MVEPHASDLGFLESPSNKQQLDGMSYCYQTLIRLIILVVVLLPSLSTADTPYLTVARDAYKAGHPAMAIKELRPHLGTDPDAQYLMGRILEEGGQGVNSNPQQAISWYARAAESDHAEAFFALGRLFERGEGLAHNYREARQWYAKGAAINHLPSQLHLGLMLNEGRGGPREVIEGLAWLSLADEMGDPAATKLLSHHLESLDTPQRAQLSQRTAELRAALPHPKPKPESTPR